MIQIIFNSIDFINFKVIEICNYLLQFFYSNTFWRLAVFASVFFNFFNQKWLQLFMKYVCV